MPFVLSNSEAEIKEPKEIRIEDCVVVEGAKFRASTKVAWASHSVWGHHHSS